MKNDLRDHRALRNDHRRGDVGSGARAGDLRIRSGFLGSGIEISPVMLPLGAGRFSFPNLPRETFKGLPGLLADSLPDKFGNLLIDQWLARQGRLPESFDPVERLCYLGTRAMGALEFQPDAAARHATGNLASGSPGPTRQRRARLPREPACESFPTAGSPRNHPPRRHFRRRRTGQGGDRMESANRRNPLGASYRFRRDSKPGC